MCCTFYVALNEKFIYPCISEDACGHDGYIMICIIDQCIMACIHHCSVAQNSFMALNIPRAPPIYPSLLPHSGCCAKGGLVVGRNKKGMIMRRCRGRMGRGPARYTPTLASLHSGLRCYAKFHRNRRVTRRKGRCVEPETANGDQGSFINV